MIIDSISNGVVIDHIQAGKSITLYKALKLDELTCSIAIIKNVNSSKMLKKDIIKVDATIDINLDVIGYIDPSVTINIIKDGVLLEKKQLELPEKVVNVIKCKNPRCITSIEQELDHVFKLTERNEKIYRCIYCEAKA